MGKTALITGGSRGIGAAVARRFASEGYDIALGLRNKASYENGGKAVLEDCLQHGIKAECFYADVSSFEQSAEMVKQVADCFGSIDVLINNAGITKDGLIVRMKEDQFDSVLDANLKSVFNMMRHVTPLMMKKRAGHIINLSSVAGVHGNASQANYAASKAGVIAMTQSVAKELGRRGILCNAIAPGPVESDMTAVLPAEVREKMLASISLGRFGTVDEIADTAWFLANTTYITGQVIIVDGGMSM